MGTFATKKILPGNPSLIPAIAEQIRTEFMAEQFEVQIDNLLSGGVDISISKGNLFKAVLGLKSALKVSLRPKDNAIAFEAGIGIFGQQAIPTIISGIWGMNVAVPFAENPFGFAAVILISILLSIIITYLLSKNKML